MSILRIFFIILLSSQALFPQKGGLELIHSDKHMGRKVDGEQLRIFIGDVHFRQDTVDMWCDKAVLYEEQNKAEFTGNVLLNDGVHRIRSHKIEYYPESRQAVCNGSVRIKGVSDSLFAHYFTYNFKSQKATAEKDVYIYNSKDNVHIWGQNANYNPDNSYSLVKNNARLIKADTAGTDSLIITAKFIDYISGESKVARAIDSVIIIQGKMRAVCDTAIYYPDEDIAYLRSQPYVWYENNELNGISVKVKFDSLQIKNIYISGEAAAKSLVDSVSNNYSRLNAKSIEFFIENKKPEKIIAIDNATSIYYLTKDNEGQGSNFSSADTITIYLQDGEFDSINIKGGAQGIFYPENYKGEKAFDE